MLTEEQLRAIAAAFCGILIVPNIGLPNPFRINLNARAIPEDIIDEIEDDMGDFGFAAHPRGPFGKDIRDAFMEISFDQRGCVYSISVVGGVKRGLGATRRRETHSTDWKAP